MIADVVSRHAAQSKLYGDIEQNLAFGMKICYNVEGSLCGRSYQTKKGGATHRMKRNKRHSRVITYFGWVIGIFLCAYMLCAIIIINNNVRNQEAILGLIEGGAAFWGTMSLGMVSCWQTKTANDISRAQLRREMITYVLLKPDVTVRATNSVSIKKVMQKLPNIFLEGIFCSTSSLSAIATDDRLNFFEFVFQFNTEGAPIEGICPVRININRELEQDKPSLFVDLNILYPSESANFVYDPTCASFTLKIYIDAPLDMLEKLSRENMFVLDLEFETVSIYGTKQLNRWGINFEQDIIHFSDLRNGARTAESFNIKNVMIYQLEEHYAER